MQSELRLLSPRELRVVYQTHMTADFPRAERKPLAMLERLNAAGRYVPLGLFEGEELLSYALLWRDAPSGLVLLDYLAVCRGGRGKGTGSRVLELLRAQYPNLFGEVEDPETAPDGETRALRLRRLEFYRRAGFVTLEYRAKVFGVRYVMLAWPPVEEQAVMEAHRRLYFSQYPPLVQRMMIHIPIERK